MKRIGLIIISIIISVVIGITVLPFLNLQDDTIIAHIWIVLLFTVTMLVIMFEDGVCKRIFKHENEKYKAKKYDYYREPLDEISPMMGAILLDKQINEPDVVSAMILYLKRKGIDIEKKLTEHDLKNVKLRMHEKFFVMNKNILLNNFYEDGYTFYNNDYTYVSYLYELTKVDLLDEEYLKDYNTFKLGFVSMLYPAFYHIALTMLMGVFVPASATSSYAISLKIIFTVAILGWCFIDLFVFYYDYHNKKNFTVKAYEYINKAKGAKRFLEDYSLISKREVKQEILFESYVQTAILLDMKGKLDTDAANYYYEILKKYNKISKEKSLKPIDGSLLIVGFIVYMLAWIWYPAEPAVNLLLCHMFGGMIGNICINSMFFSDSDSALRIKTQFELEQQKNESEEAKEKRREERDMLIENTIKINEALRNNVGTKGVVVKNIYEKDNTIEDIMEEAANLEDDND